MRTVLLPMFGAEVSQRVLTPGLSFSVVFNVFYSLATWLPASHAVNLWSCVCVCEGERVSVCVWVRVRER